MPTITANDIRIGYDVIGDGPPLVVLHGAAMARRGHLDPHLERLAAAFRLYLPDARGHGATTWDVGAGYTTAQLVADLAGFVDALGLDAFHLLGFSLGANTSLVYAASHADRLASLVLVGIGPDREPRASVARRLLDPDRIERDDPAWARSLAARHDPGQGAGAWRRLLPAIAADIAEQPLLSAAELHRIAVPTLVAVGDRDPFVTVAQAWGLVRALPDGRLLVAPECGHEVMTERPEVFAAALDDFYREEAAG